MSAATHALVGEYIMAEEAKKSEEKKDSTPESTRSIIKEASPEAVAEAEANQKKAEEEEEAKKKETEEAAKKGEGDKKPDPKAPEVDYKAELEIVSKKLEQAEFLLKKKNIEDKKKKDGEKDPEKSADEKDGDDSKPDPADVDKKLEEFKLSQLQDIISEELKSLSDNEDERALIEFHFKNSIKRSGDTKEAVKADLENARFLANRKRFEKLEDEFKAKDKSNPSAGGGSGGHNIEGDAPKETPNVSDADAQLLKRYGLKPEDIKS